MNKVDALNNNLGYGTRIKTGQDIPPQRGGMSCFPHTLVRVVLMSQPLQGDFLANPCRLANSQVGTGVPPGGLKAAQEDKGRMGAMAPQGFACALSIIT